MTCEVAVANRSAIALAADSAVTFTSLDGEQTTYASGANKIFQLATHQPVALMIYNDAGLAHIPWEVLVKKYRAELGDGRFDTLVLYRDAVIDFLNNPANPLLPLQLRAQQTTSTILEAIVIVVNEVLGRHPSLKDATQPAADHATAWAQGLSDVETSLEALPFPAVLSEGELAATRSTAGEQLEGQVSGFLKLRYAHLASAVDAKALIDLAVRYAFFKPDQVFGAAYTGLVIAGFGEAEYMPGAVNTRVCGFLGTRVYWRHIKGLAVNCTDTPSLIEPFARKVMVETFTQGMSPEVWKAVRNAFDLYAVKVCDAAAARAGTPVVAPEIIKEIVGEHVDEFTKQWVYATLDAHLKPLRTVIASLNIEELAELAETLVLLESLKEKVTSRTQSVGGPIDVAVITKSEGLVWIKRKLYFDPALNPRYLARLNQK